MEGPGTAAMLAARAYRAHLHSSLQKAISTPETGAGLSEHHH